MNVLTVRHVRLPDKTLLHLECETRALRHALWVSLYLAQDLHLVDLQDRLTPLLRDVDRQLGDFDLS